MGIVACSCTIFCSFRERLALSASFARLLSSASSKGGQCDVLSSQGQACLHYKTAGHSYLSLLSLQGQPTEEPRINLGCLPALRQRLIEAILLLKALP